MAAPQGGSGGQSDSWAGIIWTMAAIFATIGIVWYLYRNQIIFGYLTLKLWEISFLSYVSDTLNIKPGYFDQLKFNLMQARINVPNLSFENIATLGEAAGGWLKWPLSVVLVVLGFLVYFGNSARVFRRTYTMRDLAKLEKDNWPQISPVVGLDLIKTDINKGPWSMAMNPMQFCKRYRLLEEVKPQRTEGMTRRDWDRVDVVLKRGEATRIFSMQLGPLWRGIDKLPEHVKVLFAVFAARINADSGAAAKMLRQLNVSCMGKLNTSGMAELIKKHINTKEVQSRVNNHAYVYTVMAAMLEGAREDGVQASADFLWLKPLDRKLWYTLNTVGRQTPFIEVAGIFAHWTAEKNAGRKLLVPMVDEATNAVEVALKEVVYKADDSK